MLTNSRVRKGNSLCSTNVKKKKSLGLTKAQIASALLDRLLYKCEVIKPSGASYRMENKQY